MKDYLVRAIIGEGDARVLAARTTHLVEEAREKHDTAHTVTAALGRSLSGAAMLGAQLKEEGIVTIRIAGGGPIKGIIAQADHQGNVRGYAIEPRLFVPLKEDGKLDVGGAVGDQGKLYVTYDLKLKEPYTGVSELINGEIGEDLTYYLAHSEQIPSAVSLGVLVGPAGEVRASGGFMVQMMPKAESSLVEEIENRISKAAFISSLIEEGLTPEEITEKLFGEFKVQFLEKRELNYHCGCSRDRITSMLLSLGKEELQDMLEEDGGAEIRCHFCGEKNVFSEEEIRVLLKEF